MTAHASPDAFGVLTEPTSLKIQRLMPGPIERVWAYLTESNLRRMERKGMARYDDFRIIYTSDQIVNSPMAYLTTMPAELRIAIRTAVLEMPERHRDVFDRIYDGKAQPWQPVDNAAYQPVIELITFVDSLRRQRG